MNDMNYNICGVQEDSMLDTMEYYHSVGWETISVFRNDNGRLHIVVKKTERAK